MKFPGTTKRHIGIAARRESEPISLCPVSHQILVLQIFWLLWTLSLIYLEINNIYNNPGRKSNSGHAVCSNFGNYKVSKFVES